MKSNKVRRIVQILTALQAGKSYSADELARIFKTSRRTIFRDLSELAAIGVPYQYDAGSRGYKISPEFFLPPIALTLLLLAQKGAKHIQSPFENAALLAALKIESNLPAALRRHCNTALRHISTRPCPQAPTALLEKSFSLLHKAIANKRNVNITYHSLFEGKDIQARLSPYHLFYNNRAWYVLGHSNIHKSIRTFKLGRIKELEIADKCYVADNDFDLQEYLGRAWSMIPEGRIYNIKLQFMPKVAQNVSEVLWHSTQKTTFNSDGSATVEFRVDGLGEISWWILGYGDQVRVLAPEVLRKRVVEAAKKRIELNEGT
jgi:predicted DNA-binding transcriptional regulator YafY